MKVFVCACGKHYKDKRSLVFHLKKCIFDIEQSSVAEYFSTVCHRRVSWADVMISQSPAPHEFTSYSTTEAFVEKCLPANEGPGIYIAFFHPLITLLEKRKEDFVSSAETMISAWSSCPSDDELELQSLLSSAETWVKEWARRDVELVPGNLRSKIQVFEGVDVGEVWQNITYNFRHNESTILDELKKMLLFVYRRGIGFVKKSIADVGAKNPVVIPKILLDLFLEQVEGFDLHPKGFELAEHLLYTILYKKYFIP